MSLVIRERERERDRDRDWDEGGSYRSSVSHRGSPPRGSFRTVRRYRVNRPAEEEDSYDQVVERRISRTGGGPSSSSSIGHRHSDRDLRDRPYEAERRIEIDRRVERDRPRPLERDRDFDRDRPYERETRTIEIDREREVSRLPYELERYTRSAEYFAKPEPSPQPIIIRQQAPPQQIIIQEVPRDPIVIRREVEPSYDIVRREEIETEKEVTRPRRRREEHYEEYEYEREERSRDPPRRGRDRDGEEFYEREEYRRRSVSPRDSASQHGDRYSDDDLVIVKEEEYEDGHHHDHHHRRHLAEGAAAGLGAAALLSHHQKRQGEEVDHRGRKLVGSAAVGALAAEGINRVRSRSRHSRRTKSHHRSRSSSHHRAKNLATLGLGAAAVAAAVKIASNKYNENKAAGDGDGARRSRSRRRRHSMSGGTNEFDDYNSDGEPRANKHNEKHRKTRIGQAALGSAAAVGVIEAVKNKVEERRTGRSRSRSRLRQGLPIAAAALGGAGIAGIYENQQKKKEEQGMERDGRRRSRSRTSRSRSRSLGGFSDRSRSRGPVNSAGLIEYGDQPVYATGANADIYGRPQPRGRFDSTENVAAAAAGGAAIGASRAQHGRERSLSRGRGYDDDGYDSYDSDDRHGRRGKHRRHRSGSRSRSRGAKGLAEAGLAAGAAGLAAKHFTKKRERKNAELNRRDAELNHQEYSPGGYDEQYSPAPTGASAEYYPQTNAFPPPPNPAYDAPAYNPQDYPAPPHAQAPQIPGQAADPYGYAPPRPTDPYAAPGTGPRGEERTADNVSPLTTDDEDRLNGRHAPPKSVQFDLDSGRKRSSKKHRRRTRSDAGYDQTLNKSTASLPERRHRRQNRSRREDRPRSLSPAHSEDIPTIPNGSEEDGRLKATPGGGTETNARLDERLEDILNGRRASKFLKRIFNDGSGGGATASGR